MIESVRKAMANAPNKFLGVDSELLANDGIHDSTLRPARSRYGDMDSEHFTEKSRKLFPNRVMKAQISQLNLLHLNKQDSNIELYRQNPQGFSN